MWCWHDYLSGFVKYLVNALTTNFWCYFIHFALEKSPFNGGERDRRRGGKRTKVSQKVMLVLLFQQYKQRAQSRMWYVFMHSSAAEDAEEQVITKTTKIVEKSTPEAG